MTTPHPFHLTDADLAKATERHGEALRTHLDLPEAERCRFAAEWLASAIDNDDITVVDLAVAAMLLDPELADATPLRAVA